MKYWISVSGGKGSAISAILAHEHGLDFELIFADTLGEHPTTYAYIIDLSTKLQKPIRWLKDGRNIWDVFISEGIIGDSKIAPCSKILKTKPIRNYLRDHAAPDDPIVLGMDNSELDRLERAQKNWKSRPVVSLINQFKFWRPLWDAKLSEYFSYEPQSYIDGYPHNNCAGACVRAGLKQWATLLERDPVEFAKAEAGERRAMSVLNKREPFLRKTWNGVQTRMTLEEFRVLYLAGIIKAEPYDFGGCGCFIDD